MGALLWTHPADSHIFEPDDLWHEILPKRASFQHDESAPAALWAMGYQNVLFGSDGPHMEGTYGHTQKTLHEHFDDVAPDVSLRIRMGAFEEFFPHVSRPDGQGAPGPRRRAT